VVTVGESLLCCRCVFNVCGWKENLQINDIYTDIHSPIFNVIKDHYK
jgi:hypothetical protein